MPFSESATLDLNSVAFKGMRLLKPENRQVAFVGVWAPQQPLWRPGELSLAGLPDLSVCLLSLFKSVPVVSFWPLLNNGHIAFFCRKCQKRNERGDLRSCLH